MTGGDRWTVVYDGDCGLCMRWVRRLRQWDRRGRFELLPFQSGGVSDRFPGISAAEFRESVQLIGPDGTRRQGAEAVERILELVPRARPLAWVFRIPLARPIARLIYRFVAGNRGRFGCGDHCPIP